MINAGLAIFGGVITLAIIATLVGKGGQAPQVITATGNTLAKVIGAAVSPAGSAATNGNLGLGAFATPALPTIGSSLGGLFGS